MITLPNDIGGSSLKNAICLAVSYFGTPGLEYPCLGIPSLLACEPYYGGYGFSIEPETQDEYFSYLRNIKKIPKPTIEQINTAKIFIYVQFILSKIKHPLLPDHSSSKLGKKSINLPSVMFFSRRASYGGVFLSEIPLIPSRNRLKFQTISFEIISNDIV